MSLSADDAYFDNIRPVEIINSEEDDFAPVLDRYRNLIYFNSVRDKYSYFYSTKLEAKAFSKPEIIKGEINVEHKNQAYIALINEDQAIYTAYSLKNDRSYLNLFGVYFKKGKWTNPVLLDSVAGSFYTAQASVSPEGDYIIFSSVRNSKDTDRDLWTAFKQDDGTWGDLKPISTLNSPGEEITPYIKSADTLYFASNGLGGPGAYDLYKSIRIDGIWQRPFPLTELNTEFDESDITFLNDSTCLFASNRPGGKGGLDIYEAELKTNKQIKIEETEFNLSLFSTVHLIKIEKRIETEYYQNSVGNEIIKNATLQNHFFPEKLELQCLTKPENYFSTAKLVFYQNDVPIFEKNISKSKDNIQIELDSIIKAPYDGNTLLKVKATAISKANFTIEKELEIAFSDREIINNRPFVIDELNYGRIRINFNDISDEYFEQISKILTSESAKEIIIESPDLLNIKTNKLALKLKANFKNIKLKENKNIAPVNNIFIYFR